jgi:CRISPR-associated endonuclease Cas1/CRISPR-associated protein Cas4
MSFLPELIPARILNEYVYCPRLAYLEWVDRAFRDNDDTVEGRFVHRRVDRERGGRSGRDSAYTDQDPPPSTSVTVSSERLGLIAKIDVLEQRSGHAVPVEYKRGAPRSPEEPLWEPELVQLCAQALLLRDAGYAVDYGEVYFAETRKRHRIPIHEALVQRTLEAVERLRADVARDTPPPPLQDSPKCPRCSLVGICLPDEVNYLRGEAPRPKRRLVASDPASAPLYVTTQGARLSKRGGRVALMEDGKEVDSRRLVDVSHVALFGNVSISPPLLRELFDRGIPVLWLTYGGWLSGIATGMPPGNVEVRMRQHRAAAVGAIELACQFIAGKIRNSRTLIRRHARGGADEALAQLAQLARRAESVESSEELLGIEGAAARIYFAQLGPLLARRGGLDEKPFERRTRRPPTDRTNALLSFLYSLLSKDATVAAFAAGLDPYVGLFHRPRFGRPALALDLAEEFRPLICDSTALTVINNGEVSRDDFVERAGAVALTPSGRRKVIAAYERRMKSTLRHPLFGYKASYRRCLEIQARLLAAVLVGETPAYRCLTTR